MNLIQVCIRDVENEESGRWASIFFGDDVRPLFFVRRVHTANALSPEYKDAGISRVLHIKRFSLMITAQISRRIIIIFHLTLLIIIITRLHKFEKTPVSFFFISYTESVEQSN